MSSARLQLLGNFELRTDDLSVKLPFMVQRLVAFLALRGLSHRCQVAGMLWPEVGESRALASLRTSVWRVGQAIPGTLRCDGSAIGLDPTVAVDTREQEAFASTLLGDAVDDPQMVRAGLPSLRRGQLLPGWYDDWVVFERERMSQLRLHALEKAARVLTRHRQLDVALDLALEAVRAEPLRETAQAVLMSVYIAEGNVVDAIHQYDEFSRLLYGELGLAPSGQLARMLPADARR
jgi:DNA-binding SARP family transcriptional activator